MKCFKVSLLRLLLLALTVFCVSNRMSALAQSSASLSGGYEYQFKEGHDAQKSHVGFGLSAPLFLGMGWWSWTGIGQSVPVGSGERDFWASHKQGLDFNFLKGDFSVGPTIEFKAEGVQSKWKEADQFGSIGARFKAKLW